MANSAHSKLKVNGHFLLENSYIKAKKKKGEYLNAKITTPNKFDYN